MSRSKREGALSRGAGRRAQTIGVTVREMTVEIAMAKVSVQENSRSSRPITPSMKRSGMKTATSDRLIETTVKPICLEPTSAASMRLRPRSALL